MKEQFMQMPVSIEKPKNESREELTMDSEELMEAKKQQLDRVKNSVVEMFGSVEIPKELLGRMIAIRREIKDGVDSKEYLDDIDEYIDKEIQSLSVAMIFYKEGLGAGKIVSSDDETDKVVFVDGSEREFDKSSAEFVDSMRMYFDSYRLTHNAGRFRKNISDEENSMVAENKERQLNFYSDKEKKHELINRLHEKYKQAGFDKKEIEELIKTANLEKLDALEFHDINVLAKIKDIFSRFMQGDRSKYIALSAALIVPAAIDGYAPKFFVDACKSSGVDIEQVGIYAALQTISLGLSLLIDKKFKDFLDDNFRKEEGYASNIAENIAEFPGDEIGKFGTEKIKNRISGAKNSYEEILRLVSYDAFPAVVTLLTSFYVLYEKSLILAGGTVASTGLFIAMDKFVHAKGKFWEKEAAAEKESDAMYKKVDELLAAHMEIILSGEKDKFLEKMEETLSKERIALSDKKFLSTIGSKIGEFMGNINFVSAAVVAYLAGGATDKFIAAIIYSGSINRDISKLLMSRRRLSKSFRDMMQMELMFNGYAEEEKEKEKDRIGMSQISSNDISLKNASIEFENKKILHDMNLAIPGGALVSLEGLSGSGKTTMMKMLAGYYKPTSGSVEVGGTEMDKIKKSGEDSIYNKIAYLSQYPYILEDTVRNNLIFGIKGAVGDNEIKEVLTEVGLSERFVNLNEKLKGGRCDAGTASGGESSRIGLARAILKMRKNNSKIVFLDEPTASVDEETSIKIADIINMEKEKNPNVTFISISHDKNFNDSLNKTMRVKIKKGRIVE